MALGSGCAAELSLSQIPIWPAALSYSAQGIRPGRTEEVIADLDPVIDWGTADDGWKGLLADPQTSGGLLMSVDPARADVLIEALARRGEPAAVVGRMVDGESGRITIKE
jgi:selenide,water dikinase